MIQKKLEMAKDDVKASCGCKIGCVKCAAQLRFLERMAMSELPVAYWNLKMSDFQGADSIKKAVEEYTSDLKAKYVDGINVCFAGTLGTGKTYSMVNILKVALLKEFTAYYTTLGDMAMKLTTNDTKVKYNDIVSHCDFLVIDEVDSRHIAASDAAQDFFGANFERIVRYRVQNKLPILLATNNANLEDAFKGQFKKTVDSILAANTVVVAALGKDYRLQGKKNG